MAEKVKETLNSKILERDFEQNDHSHPFGGSGGRISLYCYRVALQSFENKSENEPLSQTYAKRVGSRQSQR